MSSGPAAPAHIEAPEEEEEEDDEAAEVDKTAPPFPTTEDQ
jgi:hypothetical protein